MKNIHAIIFLATIVFSSHSSVKAQNVTIPDPNFKAYLVGNTAINTNGDNEIQLNEAETFTGRIWASQLGISDLTGIEKFVALTELLCSSNSFSELNISNNTALTFLECSNNSLTSLDVSNNKALTFLHCGDNSLTSLNISNNPALTFLDCSVNSIGSLDISHNKALTFLH